MWNGVEKVSVPVVPLPGVMAVISIICPIGRDIVCAACAEARHALEHPAQVYPLDVEVQVGSAGQPVPLCS